MQLLWRLVTRAAACAGLGLAAAAVAASVARVVAATVWLGPLRLLLLLAASSAYDWRRVGPLLRLMVGADTSAGVAASAPVVGS